MIPLLILGVAFPGAAVSGHQAVVLSLIEEPVTRVSGWGFHPYWVNETGALELSSHVQRLLFEELGASIARIKVDGSIYREDLDDGTLDQERVRRTLLKEVEAIHRNEAKYFITVWNAPLPMKKYRVAPGSVSGDANVLRGDKEEEYVRFVVNILQEIRKQGLPLPVAISPANEPDRASSGFMNLPMEPAQWRRIVIQLKQELERVDLGEVMVIGPETGSLQALSDYLGSQGQWPGTELEGIAFRDFSTYAQNRELEPILIPLVGSRNIRSPIWMTKYSELESSDRMEAGINVLRRIGRDLVFLQAEYWFAWLGYSANKNASFSRGMGYVNNFALVYGQEHTALFDVLKTLWAKAPAGSAVHRVNASHECLRTFGPDYVDAYAFSGKGTISYVIVNHTAAGLSLQIGVGGEVTHAEMTSFGIGVWKSVHFFEEIDGVLEVFLPAKSAGIITFR